LNPAKCDDLDYIHFLIASVDVFTCTEAARCQPIREDSPSHDAFTRLLQRQPPDTDALWDEVKDIIRLQEGYLVIDDTTLDKPYAKKNGFSLSSMERKTTSFGEWNSIFVRCSGQMEML